MISIVDIEIQIMFVWINCEFVILTYAFLGAKIKKWFIARKKHRAD